MGSFLLISLFVLCAALAGILLLVRLLAQKQAPKGMLAAFLGLAAVAIGLSIYETQFHPFDRSGGESYMEPLDSPSGRYTASAYYRPYGGAAGGVTVWVDVTGDGGKPKTVYYAEANSRFDVQWTDEGLLSVTYEEPGYPDSDRSVELKVGKEIYNDTGKACGTLLVKMKYENCIAKMEREQ
ncbi:MULTISPECIES: DUF5412 family protein [Bhargavaea]|uniref:DUF5412 family protein n=1 Tax=Bhargavaea changchunensis TaxID=2134037 RepID=A0ABW2NDQ1_9BACL|nr:DUF5412 family protein [Bhargavaea sp. CC-171006]